MFCKECGKELEEDSKFCKVCGAALKGENIERKTVYDGNIHKCPNCGEILKAFDIKCPSCRFEIRDRNTSNSIREFCSKLERIESGRENKKIGSIFSQSLVGDNLSKTDEQKISLIRNFIIPNTKEDLYEFLILSKSNIEIDLYENTQLKSARLAVSDAWKAKFEQAYHKAKLLFNNDERMKEIQLMYDEMNKSIEQAKVRVWKTIGIIYGILIVMFIVIFGIIGLAGGFESNNTMNYKDENKDKFNEFKIEDNDFVNGFMDGVTPDMTTAKDNINEFMNIMNENKESENISGNKINDNEIKRNSQYAFMCSEWDLYLAKAVTEDTIKIEKWGKTLSSSKKVSYEYDVGIFRINDAELQFKWIDKEKISFSIFLEDAKNSELKNKKNVNFTLNINNNDEYKGTNYSEEINCYLYQNDDWHQYRAIPLNDSYIKIEAWCRTMALGNFNYGYDVCIVDLNKDDYAFEWTDNEKSSFIITMQDKTNSFHWKEENMVIFTKEKKASYSSVNEYLNKK